MAGKSKLRRSASPPPSGSSLLVAALIGVVAFACYSNTLDAGFVWDDRAAVLNNKDTNPSTPLSSLLEHDFWGQVIDSADSHKSFRPVCVLSFRWSYAYDADAIASGAPPDPYAFHLGNVLAHVATSVLLYLMASGLPAPLTLSRPQGALVGLLFAVHPVHTENVAGIVGRADVLATGFYIVAVWAYCWCGAGMAMSGGGGGGSGAPGAKEVGLWAAAIVCAVAAGLSKEIGFMAFPTFVGMDLFVVPYLARRRSSDGGGGGGGGGGGSAFTSHAVRCGATIAVAAWVIVKRMRMHGSHALRPWALYENHVVHEPSRALRAMNYAYLHSRYARLLLQPFSPLSYDWGFDSVPLLTSASDPRNAETVAAYVLVVGVAADAFLRGVGPGGPQQQRRQQRQSWRRRLRTRFGLLLALVPFVPASNLFFPVGTVIGERLLYMPSIGFCLLASQAFGLLLSATSASEEEDEDDEDEETQPLLQSSDDKRGGGGGGLLGGVLHLLLWVTAAALLLGMAHRTIERNADWHSEETIFLAATKTTPRNVRVLNNMAQVYMRSGEDDDTDAANELLTRAMEILPDYGAGHFNLGLTKHLLGDSRAAIHHLKKAIAIDAEMNSGCVYGYLGQEIALLSRSGNGKRAGEDIVAEGLRAEAISALNQALERGCSLPMVPFNLGMVYQAQEKWQLAIDHYRATLTADEDPRLEGPQRMVRANVRNMLGICQQQLDRHKDAVETFRAAIAEDPDRYELYVNAGTAALDALDGDQALEWFQRGLQLSPDSPELLNNLGLLYERVSGDAHVAEALHYYERALVLMPDHPQIQTNVKNARAAVEEKMKKEEKAQGTE